MACENIKKNLENCNCSAKTCERHGKCCECLAFHLSLGSLPACARHLQAKSE